jgi:Tfp pilus assembly protein PilE
MKNFNTHNTSQSGRSMLEMLGVLAIIGVLSVGALQGYSLAMLNHQANECVDELRTVISGVQALYADKPNYEGFTRNVMRDAGITPNVNPENNLPINVLGHYYHTNRATFGDGSPVFILQYNIFSAQLCKKILLSGLDRELGEKLKVIYVHYDSGSFSGLSWGHGTNPFPVSVTTANNVCLDDTAFMIFYVN